MSHDPRQALTVLALLTLALGGLFWSQAHSAATQDEIFSGPQAGEPTPGFTIIGSSNEFKDRSFDVVEEFAGAPTALVFVNRPTRATGRALRALDKGFTARRSDGLKVMFVILSEDQEQSERYGGQLRRSLGLDTDMGVSIDGLEGPGSYGLLKEAILTILIAKDNQVQANFALLSPNEKDAAPVMDAVDRMLAPDLSTAEGMRSEVERLRRQMAELRMADSEASSAAGMQRENGMAGMNRGRGQAADEKGAPALGPLPGLAPSDPTLGWLVQSMLRPNASLEQVSNTERLLGGFLDANPSLVSQFLGAEALVRELQMVEGPALVALGNLKQRFATGR